MRVEQKRRFYWVRLPIEYRTKLFFIKIVRSEKKKEILLFLIKERKVVNGSTAIALNGTTIVEVGPSTSTLFTWEFSKERDRYGPPHAKRSSQV